MLVKGSRPKYCQGLESCAVCTVPLCFVESIQGWSNWSRPRLPLHMHAEDSIPTFSTLDIHIGICLPKALTITRLPSYDMLKLMRMVRINRSVGHLGIRNFRLLRDAFPYWLVRSIPLKEGVPYPLQCKVTTPAAYLHWTILTFQISLNVRLPPCPQHRDSD